MPISSETTPFETPTDTAEYLTRMFRDAKDEDERLLTLINASNIINAKPTEDSGDGTVEGDMNATDWTGHANAVGTALLIKESESLQVGHKAVIYNYVGFKNVSLGVGGTYVSVASDYVAVSTSDHLLLNNIGTNTHVAIDSHIASVANPHSVTHAQLPDDGIYNHAQLDLHLDDSTIHGKYYETSTEPVGAVDGSTWYDPL